MIRNVTIKITGRVQNVGFRYHTKQMSEITGVYGYVRNLYDGSVYIEAEGPGDKIDNFISWCRKGPPRAIVEDLEINKGEIKGLTEFIISH